MPTTQTQWMKCSKCQGLFFAGHSDRGNCPSGGKHDSFGTNTLFYLMEFGDGNANTQPGWCFCKNCQGLFFSLNPDMGHCPIDKNGPIMGKGPYRHDNRDSGKYIMHRGDGGGNSQGGWKWCNKCQGLFFAGDPNHQGDCPGGKKHDATGSGNYAMLIEPSIGVETKKDQTGGDIYVSGDNFTPKARINFFADDLVGRKVPMAIGGYLTADANGKFGHDDLNKIIPGKILLCNQKVWPNQKNDVTIRAVDTVTGAIAFGMTSAYYEPH